MILSEDDLAVAMAADAQRSAAFCAVWFSGGIEADEADWAILDVLQAFEAAWVVAPDLLPGVAARGLMLSAREVGHRLAALCQLGVVEKRLERLGGRRMIWRMKGARA